MFSYSWPFQDLREQLFFAVFQLLHFKRSGIRELRRFRFIVCSPCRIPLDGHVVVDKVLVYF